MTEKQRQKNRLTITEITDEMLEIVFDTPTMKKVRRKSKNGSKS